MKISRLTAYMVALGMALQFNFALAETNPDALLKAAESGNVTAIRKALTSGIPVDATDADGWNALIIASGEGKLPAVQALLKAGADVNAASKKGETALMAAVLSGNIEIVKFLLSKGADKTAVTAKGLTAADIAEQAKKPQIAKLLAPAGTKALAEKAAPAKQTEAKESAAVEAFEKGRYDEAAKLFKELVALDPKNALAWHFLGQAREQRGDIPGAKVAYNKVLGLQSTGPVADRTKALLSRLPGEVIKDCPNCPEMVAIPTGSFDMGSPSYEVGRFSDESPIRRVNINQFALGKTEVTRGQFAIFVSATGYQVGGNCWVFSDGTWVDTPNRDWRDPGYPQTDNDPAVCISWDDARAYAEWLSQKTGKRYRLPSEAEWEYAARSGSGTARYWGDNPDLACNYANVGDEAAKSRLGITYEVHKCVDGYAYTAPAGSFKANSLGLYDMIGNVWEWTEDSYHESYNGAPANDGAWQGDGAKRVLRGGSWVNAALYSRAATRFKYVPAYRFTSVGFRLARTLP